MSEVNEENKNEEQGETPLMNSVAGSLFFGEVDEDSIFPYPSIDSDLTEMGKEISNLVKRFSEENIDSEKQDHDAEIPENVIKGLAELGLYGLQVPEEMGGMGLNYTLYCRTFSELAGHDGATATMLGAHQSIGYRALLNEGTPEQKDKWLPKLASGEVVAAFCLTEPGSGSDAYSIKTKATHNNDGTYTINGQKLWITNARLAGFYSVFCKTDHEIGGKTVEKISCFIVEGDREGITFGEKENKMGIRASETRAVYFDKVVIPEENLIGGLGKGFKIAMNVLNSGRLSLGAGCVGAMTTLIELSSKQARDRKQFGKSIADFGLIQQKLARMAAYHYCTESVVYLTTGCMDKGMNDYYMDTAVCKIFGSEALLEVANMAIQIAGGNGYMKEYPYERIIRDARINLIFEGTNEILRAFLALSGIRSPSEKLKELGKVTDVANALQDPIKSLGVLSDFAKNRISKLMFFKALTKCAPELEEYSERFSSMLAEFAIHVENTLMKHGKKIIDIELVQDRLSNMCIALHVSLAVLSRTTTILNNGSIEDKRKEDVLNITKLSLIEMRRMYMSNSKAMAKNEDEYIEKVSASLIENEGINLDILEF
jgi:acyl-CoA dehydrogenase family member 9